LILSDPETMRYYPAPYDRDGVEQWIERNRHRYQDDGVGLWAMELTKTQVSEVPGSEVQNELQRMIGDCGIILQQVEGERLYEIGYHLRRDFWGQGLATEAAIACRDWAFAHLKTDRLISLIRPENLPSCRVAERIGMTIWKEVNWRGLPHCVYSIERAQLSVP
jgi:RimJ/RimL family protein N-acetyltransferase